MGIGPTNKSAPAVELRGHFVASGTYRQGYEHCPNLKGEGECRSLRRGRSRELVDNKMPSLTSVRIVSAVRARRAKESTTIYDHTYDRQTLFYNRTYRQGPALRCFSDICI